MANEAIIRALLNQANQAGAWPPTSAPTFAQAQQSPAQGVYTIGPGPEYNKWDEALMQRGRIRIPKELDDPQTWLGQPHIKSFLERDGVDREDLPDGSVILSRKAFTS